MPKPVNLLIDNLPVTVPEGTLIVNAAKSIGNDIPVFCYHPKMEPVGMCRMCLVDIGRPVIDRGTGQAVLEPDGSPKIQYGPKLETACTTPVTEGMRVVTSSEKVKTARKEILEFLLTSHPLDCPVCDKGGECPLQNLTMVYGPSSSRFDFAEKMHLGKHVPLGDLILLDRERCIQCGRCVRFQHDIAGDPVINFYQRGRSFEIITYSDPGFDSIFSGNTTDICPVGALTTVDFHFGARPWELKSAASLCNQCPVGCNIVYNVRREDRAGGKSVIKRVMPRQNEEVNETWICDKGRFGYHYTESAERLTEPLIRRNGKLQPASWDEALDLAEAWLRKTGMSKMEADARSGQAVILVGGRLSNEDLFNMRGLGGKPILYRSMAGGDLTGQYGLSPGSNLGEMGKGSAILVVASDLHEEAPIWWLRIRQAALRGATLIVVNPRVTRLDSAAAHVVRYAYGAETATLRAFLFPDDALDALEPANPQLLNAARAFAAAENAVILFGNEGLSNQASSALARACVDLLVKTAHVGRANNGLIGVWPDGNTQGAWEMGFKTSPDLARELAQAQVVLVAGADPAGDDPALAAALKTVPFVIVQELFLTHTASQADIVFPVLAYTEREGTYTSGERRVQRYYPAVAPVPGPRSDFAIAAQLGKRIGREVDVRGAALVFQAIANTIPAYSGLNYQRLAETHPQVPVFGRKDIYFGGTSYDNQQGLGVCLQLAGATRLEEDGLGAAAPEISESGAITIPQDGLLVVPVFRLYDNGAAISFSTLLKQRLAGKTAWINPATALRHGLESGNILELCLRHDPDTNLQVALIFDDCVPLDVVLVPRQPLLADSGVKILQNSDFSRLIPE